jgi:porphobilinogen deaminase
VGALATPSGYDAAGDPDHGAAPSDARTSGELALEGLLASRDGRILLRRRATGGDPVELGRRLAADLLDNGGRALEDWSPVGESDP